MSKELQGWLVVIFGFFGFIIWAATFSMEKGVSGTGFIISQNEKIMITAPSTGLITQLNKKNGDSVLKGEVLLEYNSKPIESNLRATEESIRGLIQSNLTLQDALRSRKAHIESLKLQLKSNQELFDSGFLSANALATQQSQLSVALSDSLELQSRIEQNDSRLKEYKEKITAIDQDLTSLKVFSPASGLIMNSTVKSAGVSVNTGSLLFELVPDDGRYLVDARIPVDFADRVKPEMSVKVLFPTLEGSKSQHIDGVLIYVSADRITDPKTGVPYFEGKVKITNSDEMKNLNLRIGIPATIIINTGSRTLLSYILRPFTERLAQGLK